MILAAFWGFNGECSTDIAALSLHPQKLPWDRDLLLELGWIHLLRHMNFVHRHHFYTQKSMVKRMMWIELIACFLNYFV